MNPTSKKQIHPLLAKKKPNWVLSRATDGSLALSLSLDQDDPLLHVKSWKVLLLLLLLFKAAAAAAGSTTSVSAAALLHISESSSSSYLHPNLSTKFKTESIHRERQRDRELSLFLLERSLQRALRGDHGFVVGRWWKNNYFSAITIHFLLSLSAAAATAV
jgi:hypothetical protein